MQGYDGIPDDCRAADSSDNRGEDTGPEGRQLYFYRYMTFRAGEYYDPSHLNDVWNDK
jgi:hypothetical protein